MGGVTASHFFADQSCKSVSRFKGDAESSEPETPLSRVFFSWGMMLAFLAPRGKRVKEYHNIVKATHKLPVIISAKSSLNNCYDGEMDYAFSRDGPVEGHVFPSFSHFH